MGGLADPRAGAQAGEGTYDCAGFDGRALEMAEGFDRDAVADGHARPEEHVGLDQHILADNGVVAEGYGLRRDQGRAAVHRAGTQAILQNGFGLGQLRAGVHAAHLVLGDDLERHAMARRARDLHGVGQVIFAGLVLVTDALQQAQQRAALETP